MFGTVVWLVVGLEGRVVVVADRFIVPIDVPVVDREDEPSCAPAPWMECSDAIVDVVAFSDGCSVVTLTETEELAALASWEKLLTQRPVTTPDPMKITCVS
ncbi:MAG: hypothetical protein ABI298_00690 [Acidimicrobiales bacterium]